MALPKDQYILLGYVNMKLRDSYSSLDELCEEEGVSKDEIVSALASAGFSYDEKRNAFV